MGKDLREKKEWYKNQPRGSVPTAKDIRKQNEKNAAKVGQQLQRLLPLQVLQRESSHCRMMTLPLWVRVHHPLSTPHLGAKNLPQKQWKPKTPYNCIRIL